MEGAVVTSEEVRDASVRLPERQREALELRDRDGRSYAEIATKLEMRPSAVAQLIARARINLYDELRGTPLASVVPSAECERALPLIAMREDGQLEPSSEDVPWLESHLADCDRCALAVDQMREAETAYRAQEPACPSRQTDNPTAVAGAPVSTNRRRAVLAAALAGLLLLGGLVVVLVGANRSAAPDEPAAVRVSEQGAGLGKSGAAPARGKGKSDGGEGHEEKPPNDDAGSVGEAGEGRAAATETASVPVQHSGGEPSNRGSGGGRPSEKAAVEPTNQAAASRPSAKPKPAASSPPAPSSTASVPAPAPESTAPTEEPADEPGHRGEPPGKPADRPAR